MRLDGSRSQCGRCGIEENLLSLLGTEPRPSGPQPVAIPAELSRPLAIMKLSVTTCCQCYVIYSAILHLTITSAVEETVAFFRAFMQAGSVILARQLSALATGCKFYDTLIESAVTVLRCLLNLKTRKK
jgi:hypothetical protein